MGKKKAPKGHPIDHIYTTPDEPRLVWNPGVTRPEWMPWVDPYRTIEGHVVLMIKAWSANAVDWKGLVLAQRVEGGQLADDYVLLEVADGSKSAYDLARAFKYGEYGRLSEFWSPGEQDVSRLFADLGEISDYDAAIQLALKAEGDAIDTSDTYFVYHYNYGTTPFAAPEYLEDKIAENDEEYTFNLPKNLF